MKQLKKLGAKLRSNNKSSHNPILSTSLAQQGSSSTSPANPSQTLKLNPEIKPSESSSGLSARATHVDASHGVFIDIGRDQIQYHVAGDQYIVKVGMQDNELLLLDKLPHVKSAGYQSVHHKTCLQGTRKEELRRIEKWEADYEDKRVYWLNGTAGTGKSTLAKTFAERLFAEGRLGASFFCSRDFSNRRDIGLIFPTLAHQLAFRYPEFKTALIPIISSNPDVGHALPAVQLEHLLVQPLKSTGLFTTIIIDALDECEDNEPASAILSLLGQHIDAIPHVKFFITGRPEPPIRSGFRVPLLREHTEVFLLHMVDRASVDQDIQLYLKTCLSEIVTERSHCDLTVPWPTDQEITITIKKCSGLFIVASVIVKFVADPNREPRDRLKIIISDPDNTVYEGKSGVDATYHQILVQGFKDVDGDDAELYGQLRRVVGSIVFALNPLSCSDLATILDISPDSLWTAIRPLHSVLIVPDSNSEPLQICHKSFADFITNPSRCNDKRFYVEPGVYHLELAMSCLKLMEKKLKKNICNLPRYAMNGGVRDLGERREKYIVGGLEYACRSWAKHLHSSSRGGDNVEHVVKLLEYFFEHNLLSWLEVMSIVGDVGCGIHLLHDVKVWLANVGLRDTNLFAIVNDSERFVLRFFDVIEESASHIYDSALLWSPGSSLVRELYQDQIPQEVKLINGIDKSWDACTREVQTQSLIPLQHNGTIIFSHKDDLIAVAERGCVEILEVMTGKRRATFKSRTEDPASSLAFSPDDTALVVGYSEGSIDVWDLQTGYLVNRLEGHTDAVSSVAFSPCGAMIASCSHDQMIRIWNVPSYNCRCILEGHSDRVTSVHWTGTGCERVVSGSVDGTVRVWEVSGEKCLKTFSGHGEVQSVVSSDDSSLIAASSYSTDNDGRVMRTLKVIDAHTGDVIQMIPTYCSLISFSHHDQVMYRTGSRIVIWDFRRNASIWMFEGDGIVSAVSSDRTRIASCDRPDIVKIWQTDNTIGNRDMARTSSDAYVNCVALSGDGQLIASGHRDATVRLWDPMTGLCLKTFRGHSGSVGSVIFSPDSRLCASSSFDYAIRVWDVHTRAIVSTLKTQSHALSIIFSPNCSQLVSYRQLTSNLGDRYSTTDHLDLWEVATGDRLASTQVKGYPNKLVFDVDGTSIFAEFNNSVVEWKITPAIASNHSPDGDNENDRLSMPMVFVLIHDIHQPLSTDVPAHQPYYQEESEWVLDEQKRRISWLPPGLRSLPNDSNGKKIALGRISGIVTIIDFSGVRY